MTPGSPFSTVLPHDPDDSAFKDVLSTQVGDTTTETAARPQDSDGESSVGVERDAAGNTHEAEQDETQGQTDASGTNLTGT